MKKIAVFSIFLTVLIAFMPCIASEPDTCEDSDIIVITGKIQHYSFEGGFYGIEGNDGTVYKPLGLSEGFKIENLHVKVRGRLIKNILPFKPWGTPIEIIDIQRAGRQKKENLASPQDIENE
ncbi:MAG: hypothetical protein HQ579_05130 [Candidatus Omnitrophica bacterium]|nr:hypothetical protein [Candidatus Omnitrophota bacterium]